MKADFLEKNGILSQNTNLPTLLPSATPVSQSHDTKRKIDMITTVKTENDTELERVALRNRHLEVQGIFTSLMLVHC